MEVLFWAIAFIIFVIAELATIQLISIWLAAAALVTIAFTVIFDETSLFMQLGFFIAASVFFLAITFPWLKKRRSKGHISTNHELYIGMTATVIEEIDLNKGTGRVTLSGIDWGAVPFDGISVIPKGSVVVVEKLQGTKLAVSLKS